MHKWLLINRAIILESAFKIDLRLKQILAECDLGIDLDRCLVVEVSSLEREISILGRKDQIRKLIDRLGLKGCKIAHDDNDAFLIEGSIKDMTNTEESLTPGEIDILQEMFNNPHHMTLVRKADGKVLLCSPQAQTLSFCELNSTDIMGMNAKEVWLPDEWDRRSLYLNRDGVANNFVYEGYRRVEVIKKEPRLHKFVGDFKIVQFYDTECILGTFRFA